jgi:hypothetical protein
MPSWLPFLAQAVGMLIAGVIAWTSLSNHVVELQHRLDSEDVRIASGEKIDAEFTGLKASVAWAADHANDAKQLAATLLNDRLAHNCKGE